MGPLQYMVLGYERSHFRDQVLPELSSLSQRKVIRLLDILFVHREMDGNIWSQELSEAIPEQQGLLDSFAKDEWFTQEDVAVVGENLPDGSAAALLLFEHCWASQLEEAATQANEFLGELTRDAREVTTELEHLLATGMGTHAPI